MTEITLRPAVLGDADAIRACIRAAYADPAARIPDLPDVAAGLEDDIVQHVAILAEMQGETSGVVIFGPVGRAMMVFNLAVSPAAQGQGLARKLLAQAEAQASRSGCDRLKLTTHRLMQDTRAMYRHLGWNEVAAQGNKVFFEKPL
ncbi:N-acetylglutamate synthase, GNAT family [Ruegeria intermedia]|uniref:N-acetylglutamate synthase, GNAT family n=1 Tax=Ruegeria intermedia TaxID=996115 RepID=A0A1M4VP07_9RHOB|nr:GNAT family N-acetyltransferase [Ruegeria intermedia]SHE70709.1 N-acetylglutamate synthase, GNAT family [Ruegeria intermedia]